MEPRIVLIICLAQTKLTKDPVETKCRKLTLDVVSICRKITEKQTTDMKFYGSKLTPHFCCVLHKIPSYERWMRCNVSFIALFEYTMQSLSRKIHLKLQYLVKRHIILAVNPYLENISVISFRIIASYAVLNHYLCRCFIILKIDYPQ